MRVFPIATSTQYILVVVEYVSKQIEAVPIKTNDSHMVSRFLKEYIFSRYKVPKTLISDEGSYSYNRAL